eukprot:jgi/Galph1/548/GphlegSOOS_G5290.1
MQMEYTREGQSVGASSSMDSSFGCNTFLREHCGFFEASVIERYAKRLQTFSPTCFPYLNDQILFRVGIAL